MKGKIINIKTPEIKEIVDEEIKGMKFTKNFRSPSAEEWYIFLPNYRDPITNGATGKVIIHYNLYGNKDVFINTTIIFDNQNLHKPEFYPLVYAVSDEIVNRLVGYAFTLLSVHAGNNSYNAEYTQ